jgi:hypothetical protein
MSQFENTENANPQEQGTQRSAIEYEIIESTLINMSRDPNLLKNGYTQISLYEKNRNFYLNFLKVIFSSECTQNVKKLGASTLKIFLTKNWNDDSYITNEERLVIYIFN